MSVLADVARDIASACDLVGARWFLFGAQAAILRGVSRTTEDVDVTVDLGPATAHELARALDGAGLTLRVRDADEFIAATRVLPVWHQATGTPVDVVLAGSALEDRFFATAETVEIDGVAVRVASLESLVVMKILAGRPRDVDDATAMLLANESARTEEIRASLRELELALDQADLVPLFDAALRRAQHARSVRRR